jgi:hypothetical protein
VSLHQQLDMFPEIREIVVRIWEAALAHYATGTRKVLTREALSDRLREDGTNGPHSLSTIDRALHKYHELLPWPIKRGMRPPWETPPEKAPTSESLHVIDDEPIELRPGDRVRLASFDERGAIRMVEAVLDEDGIPRGITRLISSTSAVVAATMTAALVLDCLDGQVDTIIRWCCIIGGELHRTLG